MRKSEKEIAVFLRANESLVLNIKRDTSAFCLELEQLILCKRVIVQKENGVCFLNH